MRTIFRLTGADRVKFLDGLITNTLPETGLGYAALLTPQGKYVVDFFLWQDVEAVFLDVATEAAQDLGRRLMMYRLRSDVQIEDSGLRLTHGTGPAPDGAMADPRDPAMGWRLYGAEDGDDGTDWDALRIAHLIPEHGRELTSDSYILEMGFERLNGVDFKKGCYVGQEIVARMKHKTELRKGLAVVEGAEALTEGTEITTEDGRAVGMVHTVSGTRALAYLRFDRADKPLVAGGVSVKAL